MAGTGACPVVIVTLCDGDVPPAPVHEMEYVVVAVSAAVDFELDVARLPDQPPEAVQAVAPVDDHVRVEAVLYVTGFGEAEIETVGVTIKLQAVPERV